MSGEGELSSWHYLNANCRAAEEVRAIPEFEENSWRKLLRRKHMSRYLDVSSLGHYLTECWYNCTEKKGKMLRVTKLCTWYDVSNKNEQIRRNNNILTSVWNCWNNSHHKNTENTRSHIFKNDLPHSRIIVKKDYR